MWYFRYLNWSQMSQSSFKANCQFFYSWSYRWSMRNQRCWVIVENLLGWPNNIRVQVYFGFTAVAAIWDYSAESPVSKQVNGQEGDFRGAVFRTGRRDGPARRRRPRTVVVKCPAQVLSGLLIWCQVWYSVLLTLLFSVLYNINFSLLRNKRSKSKYVVICDLF